MNQSVILKSNHSGITLVLDPDVSFEQLLEDTVYVFNQNEEFFKNSRFAIAFTGRTLTEDEEVKMILTINQRTNANVIRITSNDEIMEQSFLYQQKEFDRFVSSNTGKFHKGTLKDKDVLESESSIIIIGDVLEGAKVFSKGNIIVLGKLLGVVHAGAGGNDKAFVLALKFHPSKLKISDINFDTNTRKKFFFKKKDEFMFSQIASVCDGKIEVKPFLTE